MEVAGVLGSPHASDLITSSVHKVQKPLWILGEVIPKEKLVGARSQATEQPLSLHGPAASAPLSWLEAAKPPPAIALPFLEVWDCLESQNSPAAFCKHFGSISSLKKRRKRRHRERKSHLEEIHLDKLRSPWDHLPGFYCIFPYSRKWERIQSSMRALLYFWENKRNLALSCGASDIHIFFWPRRLAKCQCYLQNVAVFILICKHHCCELRPFPGWGIRAGSGEVVKGDPGEGTAFWKMQT